MKKLSIFLMLMALFAPLAMNAQTNLTVCDGTTTNPYVPFYGYMGDAAQHNQMIYPASDLTDMVGKEIYQMAFYVSSGSTTLNNWTISLGETTATTLSALDQTTSLTQVYSGSLATTSGVMTIVFDNGYVYNGGNLLVDFNHPASNWGSYSFYGIEATSAAYSYSAVRNFLPKNTFSYQTPASCPKPTNLTYTLVQGNGTVANLSWTAGGDETEWTVEYATNSAFTNPQTKSVSNTPSTQLTNLTPETLYYARVIAVCGANDESEPSAEVTFTPTNSYINVVNNGTTTTGYAPLYGNYKSSYDQMIYTADQLESAGITGPCTITKIGFNSSASNSIVRLPVIYICQSDKSSFSSNTDFVSINEFTKVYDYNDHTTWSITAGWNEFVLDTPFDYDGSSNLIIAVHCAIASNYSNTSFYTAATTDNQVIYAYSDSNNPDPNTHEGNWGNYSSRGVMKNLPSLELYYTPVTVSCPKPTGLTVRANSLTAHGVTMDWDAEAGDVFNYAIELGTGIDPETVTYAGSITATTTTCSMTWNNLLADRDYTVFIRKDCGNGDYSVAATKIIHTEIACPAPTGLAGTPDGQSANITWTDTGAQSYEVVYATSASADPDNLPIDGNPTTNSYTKNNLAIDNDYYFWVRANCGGEGYSTWTGPVSVHIGYCVPAPSSVDYNGITNLTFGTGDYVVNNDSNHPTSAPYYADFSSQIGGVEAGVESQIVITYSTGSYDYQTYVWVDFDHSLTFDNDEIICSGSSNTTLTLTFTVPATTAAGDYRMRIGGADSGMDNGSDPCYTGTYGIFEDYTLRVISVACPAPTDLTATNVTPTTATLGWSGEAENYNVQYRKVAYEQSLFSEDFENGIPSTWTTIDADGDGNNWFALSEIGTIYPFYATLDLSEWAHEGNNSALSASAYNNPSDEGGGYTPLESENWLITPQVELRGTLRFYVKSTDSSWPDSYEVLLSTTGTETDDFDITLTQMTAAGSDWTAVVIDLNDYSDFGEGYIAIHHSSEDKYFLAVDDFKIFEVIESAWIPATPEEGAASVDIDGLDAEAEYEWQVQADCGDEDGVSSWSASTFTTLSACAAPTGLAYELDVHVAELSWTGFTETYNVQYREVDPDAPVTIILNVPTDIWGDDTGYQLVLDADHNTYGNTIPTSGNFTAGSFADFEYTVPENAECNASTTTIVVEGSATITIPAGVYDYVFLNPDPSSGTYYIAASQDGFFPSRGDDFEFVSGQTYEFTLSLNGSNDAITANISDNGNAWTLVEDVYGHYHTIFGLESETTYEAQVQGVDCSDDNNTDWSESVFFTTEAFTVFYKEIAGYGDQSNAGGYYLIASPIGYVYPNRVGQMTENAFDLYRFNQEASNEWEAYNTHGFQLEPGKGYLYANSEDVTLAFYGNPFEETLPIGLTYVSDNDWAGWNLVGNPYAETAYIEGIDGEAVSFYTMNPEGSRLIPVSSFTSIEPMEGVFVYAQSEGEGLNFVLADPVKGSLVSLDLSDNNGLVDRAMINFDACRPLPKFQLNDNSTKLYITLDNEDYAAVRSEEVGEMPVSFKAEENGTYTLSISAENVEFGYLHLIDNLTGDDVDLLQTPSYSFTARTTDNVNRFKLVYATGILSVSENFAFFSNGSFVINNEGDATLQVIDLNGRVISSETINGCANVNVSGAAGVYLIRLVNGENVRVQKVVVK